MRTSGRFAVISIGLLTLLCGCNHHAPPPEACNDFRIITYFDNHVMPMATIDWDGPYTRPVCIISETKVVRP